MGGRKIYYKQCPLNLNEMMSRKNSQPVSENRKHGTPMQFNHAIVKHLPKPGRPVEETIKQLTTEILIFETKFHS